MTTATIFAGSAGKVFLPFALVGALAGVMFLAPLRAGQAPGQPAAQAGSQASAPSEDEKEFFVWMDTVNQLNGKLGYFLKEKDGAESAKAAQEMQQAFTRVQSFFAAKKSAAPVKFAKGALEGFKKTEDLAAAGKLPEALQAYYDARANCEGCHKDHRVRGADGNWQIKY